MATLICSRQCLTLVNKPITSSTKRSISSSQLVIEKTRDTSRFNNKPKKEDLQFGKTISDHMLIIEWEKNKWSAPKIVPYQDLKISPAATCLNYGKGLTVTFSIGLF